MTTASQHPTDRRHSLSAVFLAVVLMSCYVDGANARAEILAPDDYRLLVAGEKYGGVRQYAVTFNLRPPRRFPSKHLELAVGAISSSGDDRPFVSFGPVWRVPLVQGRVFVDLGFSPTLIGRSTLDSRDLGGNVHFTSSVSFGAVLGRRKSLSVSLRAQHTSNGGLSSTNPGIDMLGLNVTFNFRGR